jgi:hypothetical protein
MPKNEVPVDSIPEVKAYEDAKEMLEAYISSKQTIFTTYFQLMDTLRQKRQAADQVVRAREVSCGDWDLYQFQTKVDAEIMYNALGMEAFLRLGGSTETQTIYDADKAKIEAAVSRGDISKELGEKILVRSPRYHAPKE